MRNTEGWRKAQIATTVRTSVIKPASSDPLGAVDRGGFG